MQILSLRRKKEDLGWSKWEKNLFFGNCDELDGCVYVCMCVGGSGSVNVVYGYIGRSVGCMHLCVVLIG